MDAKTFTCRCGVRLKTDWLECWIESPRTGKTLTLTSGWWRNLPPRLAPRIVAAASEGKHVLEFTLDDLKAFAAVHAKMVESTTPKGPYTSPTRTGRYSRMWSGH